VTLDFEPHEFIAFAGAVANLAANFKQGQTDRLLKPAPTHTNSLCH